MAYFKKNWSEDLQEQVCACAEKVVRALACSFAALLNTSQFQERYLAMNKEPSATAPVVKKGKANGLKKLIREVDSDDEELTPVGSMPSAMSAVNKTEPWRADFKAYMDCIEASPPVGMSTIQWWGVRHVRLYFK